jgi:hypothetical protein
MKLSLQRRRRIVAGAGAVIAAAATLSGHAAQFAPAEDVSVTANGTLRYNLGARVDKPDPLLVNTPANDASTLSVGRNHLYTNRIDVLGELEVEYKNRFGVRLSGTAWYDDAFPSRPVYNAALGSPYAGDEWTSTTKRFQKGASAEFLDAFVYGNFDVGGLRGSARLGRSVVLWGESIVATHGIAVNQAPTDLLKVLSNPGASSKETGLPVGQLWTKVDITPQWSAEAQYVYEFRHNRYPQGGTFLGITDFILDGPNRFKVGPGPAPTLRNAGLVEPSAHNGGLSVRWTPSSGVLAGDTVGAHLRQFNETGFWTNFNVPGGSYSLAFPRNTRLAGVSYGTKVAGAQVGAEISYRDNAALVSRPALINNEGARGKTAHAVLNATKLVGPTSAWDMLVVSSELSAMRLLSVGKNAAAFNGCPNDVVAANCATRDFAGLLLVLAPSWTAVAPGLDLGASLAVNYGLKGNAATLAAGNEKNGSYSIGLNATYNAVHRFSLQWNDGWARTINGAVNGAALADRGRVTFTYEVPFL